MEFNRLDIICGNFEAPTFYCISKKGTEMDMKIILKYAEDDGEFVILRSVSGDDESIFLETARNHDAGFAVKVKIEDLRLALRKFWVK